jgi:hypothetical protein
MQAMLPMRSTLRTTAVVALVLCWSATALAQSNRVYSLWTGPSTPLSGLRVAAVSATPVWVAGAGPHSFGIDECQYWTDAAGHPIPWPATVARQAGDSRHRYTRFRLGRSALSLPLAPLDLAFLAGLGVLVCGGIPLLRLVRGRAPAGDGPTGAAP